MYNLIYVSSASRLFSNEELVEILNKSRRNNTPLNITGMLLYHEGSILQILEGEKEAVTSLYNKISLDHRHKDILKMIDGDISERSFADWSMGFKYMTAGEWIALEGHINLGSIQQLAGISDGASKAIVSIIKSFAYVNNIVGKI